MSQSLKTLIVATGNPGKLREIRAELADAPVEVKGLADLETRPAEPEETGADFAENARIKARYYAEHTGCWCLADDSGLAVDALDGAPGVRSARFAADEAPASAGRAEIDQANNAKLLRLLDDVPDDQRSARFVCHLVLADPKRVIVETFDTVEGVISRTPAGDNGFGYDPLFFVPDLGCTTAELSPETKNEISHRGKAVRHFAGLLRSILASGQAGSPDRGS